MSATSHAAAGDISHATGIPLRGVRDIRRSFALRGIASVRNSPTGRCLLLTPEGERLREQVMNAAPALPGAARDLAEAVELSGCADLTPTAYAGYYISRDGRVWSSRFDGRWLQPKLTKTGYFACHLSVDNDSSMVFVHRLVATAFVPNPDGLPQVNHKDGNKLNNAIDNLEWVTSGDNTRHAYALGLIPLSTPKKVAATRRTLAKVHAALRNRTHCGNGHEYTPENTRHWSGTRVCYACVVAARRARKARAAA